MVRQERPVMIDRTLSSPQLHRVMPVAVPYSGPTKTGPGGLTILTPPESPVYSRHARSSVDLTSPDSPKQLGALSDSETPRSAKSLAVEPSTPTRGLSPTETEDGVRICPFEVEFLTDQRNQRQIFGHGAWSTVYKATCYSSKIPTRNLLTPPPSPPTNLPFLVAVKSPARNDASTVLRSEAKTLTRLMLIDDAEDYIVTFYGTLSPESSIVMRAIPSSLEDYIQKSAQRAKEERTTWNMTQPVIGSERTWLDLAYRLVSALSWLHETARVIHGDIKPGNILLSPRRDSCHLGSTLSFVPIFCDFSSSQVLDAEPTPNTLSAITREYTAPELLSSKVLRDPLSTATTASDVFSLAVTLLVAATGNTKVYSGTVWQRQAMATQGWGVIGHVRSSGDHGARVPRQGVVERTIEPAVLKEGMGRITATRWMQKIEDTLQPGPSRHGPMSS